MGRVRAIGGMQRVTYDSASASWRATGTTCTASSRVAPGRAGSRPGEPDTATVVPGFVTDAVRGMRRQSAFGTSDGHRAAWIRYPERRTTIIILTTDDAADAKGIAQRIADRLFGT